MSPRVHYKALVNDLAHVLLRSQTETAELLTAIFGFIGDQVFEQKTSRFCIPRFGTFVLKHRKARWVLQPGTRIRLWLPAQESLGFRASMHLKRRMDGKSKQKRKAS